MAILLALFSVVLLVYCTGVCASLESDLVVLTTASRLREEIKSQLDETEFCLRIAVPVLPVQGVQYSRVCGKIIGYQQGSTDAFGAHIHHGQRTIGSHYVDGISLTHGTSPRKTFGHLLQHFMSITLVCPCTNTRNSPPPAVPHFKGHDYFCDTGSENHFQFIFYGADPLWDGAGCGQFSTCCSWNSPPWFLKNISPPTSDDIEMRLCTNEPRSNEDVYFETLEIYVQ